MQIELTITADRSELPPIVSALSEIEDNIEVSVGTDEESQPVVDLTEEEQYVLAAVQEASGSALRVIHRTTNELEGSPFNGYSEADGWNEEREEVQELLWSLKSDDLVRNDGQQWYLTDSAPTNILG